MKKLTQAQFEKLMTLKESILTEQEKEQIFNFKHDRAMKILREMKKIQ